MNLLFRIFTLTRFSNFHPERYFAIFWRYTEDFEHCLSILLLNRMIRDTIDITYGIIYNSAVRKNQFFSSWTLWRSNSHSLNLENHAEWNDSTNFSTKFFSLSAVLIVFQWHIVDSKSFVPGFSTGKRSVSRASIYKRGL